MLPLLLLLNGCTQLGLFNAVVPQDAGVSLVGSAIAYGPEPRQKLDVYAPAAEARNGKIIVFLYGGSWNSGQRRDYAFAGRAFAARGYVTVVPDDRLVPAVRYPVFVQDNAKAVAWAAAHARDFGADARRLYLVGHSGGAYDAVMLAVAPEFLRAEGLTPRTVRAVAALSGPYEFIPLDQPETREAFKGVQHLARTQPIGRLMRGRYVPPMLLVHGEDDDFVRPSNSEHLAEALRQTGHQVTLRLHPGVGHRGTLLSLAKPLRGHAPVLDDVADFLDRH